MSLEQMNDAPLENEGNEEFISVELADKSKGADSEHKFIRAVL